MEVNMDTIQFRYFVAVAEQHSFTAAAARFGITQPTICRQISALEEELGTTLLRRSTHGVALTSAGAECLDYAYRLLNLEDQTLSRVVNISEGRSGIVRLAALPACMSSLSRCLSCFAQRYPDIQVDVDMLSTIPTLESTEMREYDVFFAIDSIMTDRSTFDVLLYSREQLHILVPREQAAQITGQDFSLLSDLPFFSISQVSAPFLWSQVIAVCRARGLRLRFSGYYNHIHAALIAVNAGAGFTILPHSALAPFDLSNVTAIPIEGEDAVNNFAIAWRKASNNLAATRFIEVTQELYPSLS